MKSRPTVTVFGSSSPEEGSEEYDTAYRLGAELAGAGFDLCNGGYGGTMAAGARGARDSGASTTGIILAGSPRRANRWIEEAVEADGLWDRMQRLMERAHGFAVLPGGTGTLAELAMMLELMNKEVIGLAPAALIGDHWDPLVALMDDESILRDDAGLSPVQGVEVRGAVGIAEGPAPAAAWLEANVRPLC